MVFSKEQSAAIEHVNGPMMVIAGPGSGKTTVITHRIKYMIESAGVSPADILVITFTRAAAYEMESRFRELTKGKNYRVRFGTFHSIFFWIIKTAYGLNNSNVISETDKRILIEQIMKELGIEPETYGSKEDVISEIIAEIGIVKCDMFDIDSYYSKHMPEEEFRQIYIRLDRRLKEKKLIDFDDMLVMCYDLLIKREDILTSCQNLFKYIMVDEFQDSNRIQYEIFKLLAKPQNNAFIVGDDDQSVYGFRGAKPEIMQIFKADFKNTKEVFLNVNYRCDQAITKASSMVISQNKKRFAKTLTSNSEKEGSVTLLYPEDILEQNDSIIAKIVDKYKAGIPFEKQAVIYRTNVEPVRLAYRLDQYNIPYTLSDRLPNIFDHFAIKNCLDYMSFAKGNRSRALFLRIMNKPVRYITRDSLVEDEIDLDILMNRFKSKPYVYENVDKLESDIYVLSKMRPFAALNYIRRGVGYDDYIASYAAEKKLDYNEIMDILDEFGYMIKDIATYEEMLEFIDEYRGNLEKMKEKNKDIKGVKLITMHSSKGLEFDVVYIIDAVEGVTPYKKAKTAAELEEERRMFYVAMTRARHELYIYSPKKMAGVKKEISRYVSPKNNYKQ